MFLPFTIDNREALMFSGKSAKNFFKKATGFLEVIPSEELKNDCLTLDGKFFVAVEEDEACVVFELPRYREVGTANKFKAERFEDFKTNPPMMVIRKVGDYLPEGLCTVAVEQIDLV